MPHTHAAMTKVTLKRETRHHRVKNTFTVHLLPAGTSSIGYHMMLYRELQKLDNTTQKLQMCVCVRERVSTCVCTLVCVYVKQLDVMSICVLSYN
jgi:hypothetical protein